jgi:hypothetical protein
MINVITLADELTENIFKYYQNRALFSGASSHDAPQITDEATNYSINSRTRAVP